MNCHSVDLDKLPAIFIIYYRGWFHGENSLLDQKIIIVLGFAENSSSIYSSLDGSLWLGGQAASTWFCHTGENDEHCSARHPTWLRPENEASTAPHSTRYTSLIDLILSISWVQLISLMVVIIFQILSSFIYQNLLRKYDRYGDFKRWCCALTTIQSRDDENCKRWRTCANYAVCAVFIHRMYSLYIIVHFYVVWRIRSQTHETTP